MAQVITPSFPSPNASTTIATTHYEFDPDQVPYEPNAILLGSLLEFYSQPQHIEQLYKFISGEDKISLRLLEWTVINYARDEEIIIDNGITSRFYVHMGYKAALTGYHKEQFDPCCRTERINIPYMNKLLETTIGQMNFIRWAIENRVLDYIRENYTMLFNKMKQRSKTVKRSAAASTTAGATSETNTTGGGGGGRTRKRRSNSLNHTVKNYYSETCTTILRFNV